MSKLVQIRVFDAALQRAFREAERRCKHLRPVFEAIGELLVKSVRKNFQAGGRPSAWPRRKERKGKRLLRETGRLERSITAQPDDDSVVVGSDLPYAAAHNFGSTHLPPRPFLAVQPEDETEMAGVLERYVAEAMR